MQILEILAILEGAEPARVEFSRIFEDFLEILKQNEEIPSKSKKSEEI